MGYELKPKNEQESSFHFGAFSFPVLLEACGYLFPCIHRSAQWYCHFPTDERMIGKDPGGSQEAYPSILGGGFEATDEEAHIMARMAHNFVVVQRALPEENRVEGLRGKKELKREDLLHMLMRSMAEGSAPPGPWPPKVRDDFTEKIELFSDWAPKSGGFTVHFSLIINDNGDRRDVAFEGRNGEMDSA